MESCSEQMVSAALEAQKLVRKYFVVELNFEPPTLRELDSLLDDDDVEYALPGGKSQANLDLLERTWGAYLGEVLRRNVGGEWKWDDQGEPPRPVLECGEHRIHPLDFARTRVAGESSQSFQEFYDEQRDTLS